MAKSGSLGQAIKGLPPIVWVFSAIAIGYMLCYYPMFLVISKIIVGRGIGNSVTVGNAMVFYSVATIVGGVVFGFAEKFLKNKTMFVMLVAAISLVVGGIGVMNIMLVSVTERTREIGIRKSIGATTASITLQFLAESAIIAVMGGGIGILAGTILSAIICAAIHMKLVISPLVMLSAAGVSMGIGMFFGIYPARKAAHLSPMECLRHE